MHLPALKLSTIGAPVRLASRMIVAAMVAFAIGASFNLTQSVWAVISAILIVQGTAGGTLRAAIDRLIGTVIGSTAGAAAVYLKILTGWPEWVILPIMLIPGAGAAGWQPRYRVAPVTAVIIFLAIPGASPYDTAAERIAEIALGSLVGIATSFMIIPGRAHSVLNGQAAAALRQFAEFAKLHLISAPEAADPEKLGSYARRIVQCFAAMETTIGDAKLERLTAGGVPPDALLRTLRRTYNDIVFMGRAVGHGAAQPPTPDSAALAPLREALCGWLEEAARLILADQELPPLDPVEHTIEALVSDPLHPDLLGFTLLALRAHLTDLRDRLIEFESH